MYSAVNRLGDLPDAGWYDEYGLESSSERRTAGDVNSVNLLSDMYLSPSAGYPPQRIENYDLPLAEHVTLNGVGVSRIPARPRPMRFFAPHVGLRRGAPRTPARMAAPRLTGRPMGRFLRGR